MSRIADWGTALWTSFTGAISGIFAFIPRLVGFLVILLIGWIVASLVAKAVTLLLRKIGFDEFSDRLGMAKVEQRLRTRIDMPRVLGTIVFWFLFLIFLVPAVNALELTSISLILSQLIGYIPNVFVAVLVLFLGLLFGNFVGDLVQRAASGGRVGNPVLLGNVARYTLMGFAAIVALQQLRIAPELFQILFSAVVGAAALAFGLAFGLGGREAAQRWLARNQQQAGWPAQPNPVPQETERPPSMAGTRSEQRRGVS